VTGYHRTGGNLRTNKKTRKRPVKSFTSGQHIDPRMSLTIADIKRMYPEMCAVPKRVELIDDSNKWNRQAR
jgi:hypothetical protein